MPDKITRRDGLLVCLVTQYRWFFGGIFCLIIFLCWLEASRAESFNETRLKALYTYNFGKFTHWPEGRFPTARSPFRYCILGQNPFSQSTLVLLAGNTVQGHRLIIDIFDSGLAPKTALSECHLLFISASEKYRFTTILRGLSTLPILTVSDIFQFSQSGGMITLVQKSDKLGFQINPSAFKKAGVTMGCD